MVDIRYQGPTVRADTPRLSAAALAAPFDGLGQGPQTPKRVVVIGAGVAGLACAFELARAGHQPIVLEARDRVGGRVFTMRDFAAGLYGEAGAMVIPNQHELTLRYCELFGLSLRPVDALPAGFDRSANDPGTSEIVGGTDRLTDAFFTKVARHVRLGAEVVAIEQDDETVTVHFTTRAGRFAVHGDYAVCTLPLPVLANIEVVPGLSSQKRRATVQVPYDAATTVLLQVRHRFWEHPKYDIGGGALITDLPIRRIVYPSHPDQSTSRGVLLASYTWGPDALPWDAMDTEARIRRAISDVARIHPEIVEEFEVGASWSWLNDRYAGGAAARFDPGRTAGVVAGLAAPEGRLRFAGEHSSIHHGWIQGALESALRAAGEIHSAPMATAGQASLSG